MPDPHTIPFKEASANGHYESKQLPYDREDFLEALGLPEFAGDVVSASTGGVVGGEVATFWGTDGHTIKAANQTGLAKLASGVLSSVPAPIGAVVGTTDVQTLTNKTIDNPVVIGAVTGLDKFDVGLGNVDNTSDANKPISTATQAALDDKENAAEKGVSNGYASLDVAGKVPLDEIPDAVIGASRYQGTWNAATNTPPIPLATLANQGYYYSVAVGGSTSIDGISTWVVGDQIISNGSIWQKIPVANAVLSVNAKQGVVVINKADVGLGNVDNTSDVTKNSTAATLTNKIISGASNTLTVRLNTSDVTGDLPVNKLDGGTAASAATFWRGDGHWVSPSGGGDVVGPGSSTDGSLVLFNGLTGKTVKGYSGSAGFAKLDLAGVVTGQTQMQSGDISAAMITGQTEKASVVDPDDQFLEVDRVSGQLRMIRARWFSRLPLNYLAGYTLSNSVVDATNDLNVAAGQCRDDTNVGDIVLNSTITKRLDAAWVVGTDQGGRDTGAIADGSWHVFAIFNPTTGVVDVLFSLSATAPTMPSGFTLKRRIGSAIRVSGTIRAFRQVGDLFGWVTPILDANGGTVTTGSSIVQPLGGSIPAGFKFECGFNAHIINTTQYVGIEFCDADCTTGGGAGTVWNAGANINSSCFVVVMTNTASSIRVIGMAGSGTTSYYVAVNWYRDTRGK